MKMSSLMKPAIVALALVAPATLLHAATITTPVTGWMVHNGTSTVGGTAASPTFTPGDNVTLMAPFSDVTLYSDGDYVEATTTLTLNTRTANTGANALNTQLRFALLDDSANAGLTANDFPNLGFTIEYSNLAAGGLIREQQSTTQTNPFTSPVTLGNGAQDSGADTIQGANPGPITFTLRLSRNSGNLDLTGSISGTDSVSGNPYLANFAFAGINSANFPANGTFAFNRVAVFLGGNADATTASLDNSSVTTNVPEPGTLILAAIFAIAGGFPGRRRCSTL